MAQWAISDIAACHESGLPEIAAQFPAYTDLVISLLRALETGQRAICDIAACGESGLPEIAAQFPAYTDLVISLPSTPELPRGLSPT